MAARRRRPTGVVHEDEQNLVKTAPVCGHPKVGWRQGLYLNALGRETAGRPRALIENRRDMYRLGLDREKTMVDLGECQQVIHEI